MLTFGTGTFGGQGELCAAWGNSEVKEATRLVDVCLEAGLTMFDSADVYSGGLAEEILGQAIKGRRDQVIVSTKTSLPMGDGPGDAGSSRSRLISACEDALRRLGTDYIDLFQLHAFDAGTPIEEVLSTLDELVRAAQVDHRRRRPRQLAPIDDQVGAAAQRLGHLGEHARVGAPGQVGA